MRDIKLPEALLEQIDVRAKESGYSLPIEIEIRLQASLHRDSERDSSDLRLYSKVIQESGIES